MAPMELGKTGDDLHGSFLFVGNEPHESRFKIVVRKPRQIVSHWFLPGDFRRAAEIFFPNGYTIERAKKFHPKS